MQEGPIITGDHSAFSNKWAKDEVAVCISLATDTYSLSTHLALVYMNDFQEKKRELV